MINATVQLQRLKPDTIFSSDGLNQDLARKSAYGGIATLGSQGVRSALRIFETAVLARLLTPTDFGLISMVSVVINFATVFKDAGLSMATVQKKNITSEQASTLFWLNLLISAALGLCVLMSSPLVAWFYKESHLTAITAVLSLSFIVGGVTIQHEALLRRHMRFGELAFVQIASQSVTMLVTIGLALAGCRHWALVGGTLTLALVSSALTLLYCPWLPGGMKRGAGVRDMLTFGSHLTGFNFVNYFSRNADSMLIGRFIDADALGLYSKAYQVLYLPLATVRNPINAVAFPVLSKMRDEPERFRKYYRTIVHAMAFFSMPVAAFCIVFPNELVTLLFGDRWLGMTAVFRILAIAGFSQTVTGTRGMVLLAFGRSRKYFVLGVVRALLNILGFAVGLRWGIVGVATSLVVTSYLPEYYLFRYAFENTPCTLRDLFDSSSYVAVISWLSVASAWAVTRQLSHSDLGVLLIAAALMGILYLGSSLALPRSRRQILSSLATLAK